MQQPNSPYYVIVDYNLRTLSRVIGRIVQWPKARVLSRPLTQGFHHSFRVEKIDRTVGLIPPLCFAVAPQHTGNHGPLHEFVLLWHKYQTNLESAATGLLPQAVVFRYLN